jgi:mannose-6-phosphate isomerase-like protein (cupin superfamily)
MSFYNQQNQEDSMEESAQGHALEHITYCRPNLTGKRGISGLVGTPLLNVVVQTVKPGGRQGLHAHGSYDGFYFVLKGRAKFYGEGNKLFAEVGANEGVLVPHGVAYAFEAADEEVQMLAVDAIDKTLPDTFVCHEPGADARNYELFTAEGAAMKVDFTLNVVQG